ncbi:hypothetical protein JST56_03550 [Candidatus Dependentiae bacterium]|jgi:hypothetical protein|nr:hypothetical protein [Candidatus Dependentiae bacterium]
MKLLYFFATTSLLLCFNQLFSVPTFEDFIKDIRYLYANSEATISEDEKEDSQSVLIRGMEQVCKQYMQKFQRIMSARDFKEISDWSLTFFLFKYAKEGKINDLQELITKFPNLKRDPQDGNGKIPADYARENGHTECENLLIIQT